MAQPDDKNIPENKREPGPTPEPKTSLPDDGKKPPEFNTIFPDKILNEQDKLFSEFDNYQKKLQTEWESAKSAYEEKMDEIMRQANFQDVDFEPRKKDPFPPPAEKIEKTESSTKPTENPRPPVSPERMHELLSDVERTLRKSLPKGRGLPFFGERRPPVINVSPVSFREFVRQGGLRWIFLALILVAGGWGFYFWNTPQTISPLPYSNGTTPFIEGKTLFTVDWFRKALYKHDLKRGLPIKAIENLPNSFVTGFAKSKESIWTADGFSGDIIVHRLSDDHRSIQKVPAPGPKPTGLYFDGTDVWAGDATDKMIYQLRSNDLGSVRNKFKIPNGTVTSFLIKENRLWLLDGEARMVRVFRIENPLRELASFDLDSFLNGGAPTGITNNGNTFYITTINPPQLIRIPRRHLEKANINDF